MINWAKAWSRAALRYSGLDHERFKRALDGAFKAAARKRALDERRMEEDRLNHKPANGA